MASFNINYPGSPGDFVVSANDTIKTKGGIFTGDQKAGTFSLKTLIGAIKGNYLVLPVTAGKPTEVAITITQKPMLVPLSKIKQVIEGYF
jgi:hypothetical protein